MRLICLWILAGLAVWPISSTVVMVGEKPIDMILSDLMFFALPVFYLVIRSNPPVVQTKSVAVPTPNRWYSLSPYLAAITILYMTSLAGIGLGMSEEWIRVYSAFKLTKPIAFVILGLLMGGWTDPFEFIDLLGRAFGVLVGLTVFYTVTDPYFPMGDWGKYISEWELSGYPNAPMTFYAVMVPLLIAAGDTARLKHLRFVAWSLAAGAALIIVGSMSRSSTIVMFLGTTFYLVRTGRGTILIGTAAAISLISIVGIGVFSAIEDTEFFAVLSDRVRARIDRSTEQDDPLSGRTDIWQVAIELSMEKPAFGYMFESFSRYSGGFDTPHQQYLEVLYKCGSIGLLLYLSLLASCLFATRRLLILTPQGAASWYRLHAVSAMLWGVLIGNLTQPNLTYSVTGNMVFLVFGSLCSERAMLSVLQSTEKLTTPIVRPSLIARPRIAA